MGAPKRHLALESRRGRRRDPRRLPAIRLVADARIARGATDCRSRGCLEPKRTRLLWSS